MGVGQGELGHSLHWGFHGKGKAGQRTQSRIVSLNHSSGLWGIGAFPHCLAPDPWMT